MSTRPKPPDERDNVAVPLAVFAPDTDVLLMVADERRRVRDREDPLGTKFSIVDIPAGGPIVKYGAVIGLATWDHRTANHR